LTSVRSFKDLHARLLGFDPAQRAATLGDFQFMAVLAYDKRPVLAVTLQGSAASMEEPQEDSEDIREMYIPGERYEVPLWNIDTAFDAAWLSNTRIEPEDEQEVPQDEYEQLCSDVEDFLGVAYDDPDTLCRLTISVVAFRTSDQRTAVVMSHRSPVAEIVDGAQLVFEQSLNSYPGRHRRRTETFTNLDTDELCVMACLMADRATPSEGSASAGVRWRLALHLHCDVERSNGAEYERIAVPHAEFLRFLDGATWV